MKKEKNAIMFIQGRGDPSVGIYGGHLTINFDMPLDEEERKGAKEVFIEAAKNFFDDRCIDAWFDDECSECGQKLIRNKCRNKDCPSNYDDA